MLKRKTALHPNCTDTVIGEGTTVEGHISSKASLRIEGRIVGDVHSSGDITIGEKGFVNSHMSARNIINAGFAQGSITTKGTLMITATGKVYGDINVSSLQIVEGGIFQGTSRMETKVNIDRVPEKEKEIEIEKEIEAKSVPTKVESKITAVK